MDREKVCSCDYSLCLSVLITPPDSRAAERYADLTPEAYARRRQKGWGNNVSLVLITHPTIYSAVRSSQSGQPEQPPILQDPNRPQGGNSSGVTLAEGSSPPFRLHIETHFNNGKPLPDTPPVVLPLNTGPTPSIGEALPPTRLRVHQFGSRFLPHTTAPIRCLLPILGDRFLLLGHDDGLSVMDMYPKEWTELGLAEKGPNDAQVRPIWTGEGSVFCFHPF